MLAHSKGGPGRGSYITGRSVHNSRIGRLWRDVYETVLSNFYDLFTDMENAGILDPDNNNDMFCLLAVYQLLINEMLQRFAESWNNHKIRTAASKTPVQLFKNGDAAYP